VIDPNAPSFADVAGSWLMLSVPLGIVAGLLVLGAWMFNRAAPGIVEKL
jgi:hypothetical protein